MRKKLFNNLIKSVKEMMEIRSAEKENRIPKCTQCGSDLERFVVSYYNVVRYRCNKCEGIDKRSS